MGNAGDIHHAAARKAHGRSLTLACAAALLALPQGAMAQALPYKLVISWYQSNLTVIDYPSKARCEAAAQVINDGVALRSAIAESKLPPGTIKIGESVNLAFCIPG